MKARNRHGFPPKRPLLKGEAIIQGDDDVFFSSFPAEQLVKFLTCARVRIRGLKNLSTMRATSSVLNATKCVIYGGNCPKSANCSKRDMPLS